MASFNVEGKDGFLLASWNIQSPQESGEIILNNLTRKTYATKKLSVSEFAVGSILFTVVNGDSYNVRLITNTSGRNQVYSNVCGKSAPQKLSVELESRNQEIGIKLLNYSLSLALSNGFNEITGFDVLIDKHDDQDELQHFDVNQIVDNNRLIVSTLNGLSLVNGQLYEVVVRQVNGVGAGDFSDVAEVSPSAKPAKINNFAAAVSNARIDLSWEASPSNNIFYKLYQKLHTSLVWSDMVTLPKTYSYDASGNPQTANYVSYPVLNLLNGTSYDFQLVVHSPLYGSSIESALEDKVPYTLPSQMSASNVSIRDLSNNSIEVTLSPPDNGGKAVIKYKMIRQGDASPQTNYAYDASFNNISKVAKFVINNLPAGQENIFQISAMNSNVENTNVYALPYTQYSNPEPVQSLSATNMTEPLSSNGQVRLSWVSPANKGGVTVNSELEHIIKHNTYVTDLSSGVISAGPDKYVSASSLLTFDITGLYTGKSYTFSVQSKFIKNNANFVSNYSSAFSITPYCAPAPPLPVIDMSGADIKFTWPKPELYGLPFKKYQHKFVLASVNPSNITTYSDVLIVDERVKTFTPPNYGVAYKLYMKTHTLLPNNPDQVSDESVSLEYIPYKNPDIVTDLQLYPLDEAVEVKWVEPSFKGGFSVIKYNIAVNGLLYKQAHNSTNIRISGLKNEQVYIVVIAVGYLNNEPILKSDPVVDSTYPYSDPEKPTELSLTPGNQQITLNWKASATAVSGAVSGAPVISYIIFRDDRKINIPDISGGVVTYIDTGRVNGTTYNYRVVTKQTFSDNNKETYSDNFSSSEDSKSATPFKVPDAPSGVSLVAADQQITVNWLAPTYLNGLSSPAQYRVIVTDPSGVNVGQVTTPNLTALFSRLTNGKTYNVTVETTAENKEENVAGWYFSEPIPKSIAPNAVPNPPLNVVATPDNLKIAVTWGANLNDSYTTSGYDIYKNGIICGSVGADVLSFNVLSLTNGTEYSIGVQRKTSGAEVSQIVEYGAKVTPFGIPILQGSPSVVLDASNSQISITVKPNGSALTNLILFAGPKEYDAQDVLFDNISPLSTEKVADVTNVAYTMKVKKGISSVFYVVANAAGVLSGQHAFPV